MADLKVNVAPGNVSLNVAGVRQDGGNADLASVTFTVESGTATTTAGSDKQSQTIIVIDSNPTVIRVDANADLKGGSRIITARLFLNGGAANVPANEAVSLILTTN